MAKKYSYELGDCHVAMTDSIRSKRRGALRHANSAAKVYHVMPVLSTACLITNFTFCFDSLVENPGKGCKLCSTL
jgi:hypothetical protein